uniref:Ig-like domain-containing protein n=1 Tax=Anopheles maculatus TaxID=74869 RepID=A0A182SHM8_9DIPT
MLYGARQRTITLHIPAFGVDKLMTQEKFCFRSKKTGRPIAFDGRLQLLCYPFEQTSRVMRPLSVRLQGKNRPLSANHTYDLQCEVLGSRPAPTITWWKGSTQMRGHHETLALDTMELD